MQAEFEMGFFFFAPLPKDGIESQARKVNKNSLHQKKARRCILYTVWIVKPLADRQTNECGNLDRQTDRHTNASACDED